MDDNSVVSRSLYHVISLQYPYKTSFRDKYKESGQLRDLLEELSNKGVAHSIYYNKTNNGCTVFYDDYNGRY